MAAPADATSTSAQHWASDLLGPTLLVKGGAGGAAPVAKPTAEVVAGKKLVLLYFSASWCPPCKLFTPVLSVVYEDAKEDEDAVEIVYIASDFDEPSFAEYFAKQPWAALPFVPNGKLAQELGRTFGVRGIPTLVALDGTDGALLTTDARSMVQAKRSLDGLAALPRGAPAKRGQAVAAAGSGAGGDSLLLALADALSCGLASRLCGGGKRGGGKGDKAK